MALILYKKGNTHTVNGVKCEVGKFEYEELHAMLKEGWVNDPIKIKKPVRKPRNGKPKV